jgi:hypothetical protein
MRLAATSMIFILKRLTEPGELSDPENGLKNWGYESDILAVLESTDDLKRLWEEIITLPLRHRTALLLNLRGREGDGIIAMFPLSRIASVRQIGETLELSPDKFARIWHELPWSDITIGEYLGITRQQVINLRQSARAALRKRLGRNKLG